MSHSADKHLAEICETFRTLKDGDAVHTFLAQFGFSTDGVDQNPRPQTIMVAKLCLDDGREVTLSERWYDPSGPFQNAPDVHVAWLEVGWKTVAEIRFQA